MNRIIKFRGRRVDNGEWVYGFYRLAFDGEACFILNYTMGQFIPSEQWFEVEPKTVGQFTGFHDMNSKEVYEGDILIYDTETSMSDMHVKFENGSLVGEGPFTKYTLHSYLTASDFLRIEVSGTIHDKT